MMKKAICILTAAITITSAFTVSAADIPLESAPMGADAESVQITQNLVGHILDEIVNPLYFPIQ